MQKITLLAFILFHPHLAPAAARNDSARADFEQYSFTRTSGETTRHGIRTDGVVVLSGGKRIYERYADGYDASALHVAWSISKSTSSALYGIATGERKLSLSADVCDSFPAMKENGTCGISFADLLHMSSGLQWKEGYEHNPAGSNDIEMLFAGGCGDVVGYAAAQPQSVAPGTLWYYSSGDANLAMGMLRAALGDAYADYPWKKIFGPLGMKHAVFERDGAGNYIGSDGVYATPRELANFGLLYLNDGVWEGRRILPEGWVTFSRTLAPTFSTPPADLDWGRAMYGGHWWINAAPAAPGLGVSWPDAPSDTYAALGFRGQSISVIPSLNLVIVRTADDRDDTFDMNRFLGLAVRAFSNFSPLPFFPPPHRGGVAEIFALPQYAAGFTVKQVCSCRFVQGRDAEYCRKLGRQSVPVVTRIDPVQKSVTGSFLTWRARAHYAGSRYGCTLD